MKAPIAVHFIAPSLNDQPLAFAISQFNALLTKAARIGAPSYEVREQGMVGSRTLALFCHPPAVIAMETQRESEGMAWTDDETDHLPSHED